MGLTAVQQWLIDARGSALISPRSLSSSGHSVMWWEVDLGCHSRDGRHLFFRDGFLLPSTTARFYEMSTVAWLHRARSREVESHSFLISRFLPLSSTLFFIHLLFLPPLFPHSMISFHCFSFVSRSLLNLHSPFHPLGLALTLAVWLRKTGFSIRSCSPPTQLLGFKWPGTEALYYCLLHGRSHPGRPLTSP
jgi:hypothetical protein